MSPECPPCSCQALGLQLDETDPLSSRGLASGEGRGTDDFKAVWSVLQEVESAIGRRPVMHSGNWDDVPEEHPCCI